MILMYVPNLHGVYRGYEHYQGWSSVTPIHLFVFFFSSRRRHTRCSRDWSSDVCSSDLGIHAGKAFLARLKERSQNRDKEITVTALQAQLKALRRWGSKEPADLSKIHQPVLVANGDSDRMVPSRNTHDLAQRLPNSDLIIYPDSGHGAVFQFHADFVPKALEFLAR